MQTCTGFLLNTWNASALIDRNLRNFFVSMFSSSSACLTYNRKCHKKIKRFLNFEISLIREYTLPEVAGSNARLNGDTFIFFKYTCFRGKLKTSQISKKYPCCRKKKWYQFGEGKVVFTILHLWWWNALIPQHRQTMLEKKYTSRIKDAQN